MKSRSKVPGICAFIGMMIIILDGKTALQGAQQGIELCLKSAIPALFPFFVLSILLTGALSDVTIPLMIPIGKVLRIPKGCESILIPAFLGGYPAGAQSIAQLYHYNRLDKQTAERLLSFCSNTGPAFLFGMAAPLFSNKYLIWFLWIIHILGAVISAILIQPPAPKVSQSQHRGNDHSPDIIQSAIKVMASVCAWITVFRIIIAIIQRWVLWFLPATGRIAVIGLLEMSNGCIELHQITDEKLRFLLCSGFLAFGGICVIMQTATVTKGLSIKYYLWGKIMQSLFSIAVSLGILFHIWIPALSWGVILFVCLIKKQKNCGNLETIGV